MEHFGTVLKTHREAAGMTQKDVWTLMKAAGADIAYNSLSRWEKGERSMEASMFLLYCQAVGIDSLDEFSSTGQKLDAEGLRRLHEYRDVLLRAGYVAGPKRVILRTIPLYDQAVSAGIGQFLDSDAYTPHPLYLGEPEETTYALRVAGDSMEPAIHDGDIIFIQQQQELHEGEIGVFAYDNESWVKRLEYDGKQPMLVSLNPDYEPVRVREGMGFRVRGKYLGRREN